MTITDVSSTAADRAAAAKAAVHNRLVAPMPPDRWIGWVMTLLVTAIAAAIRLNGLGTPPSQIFDEAHYRKDAHDIYRYGFEKSADYMGPGYKTHPPLGKWLLGWGQRVFDWDNQEIYTRTLSGDHAAFSWRIGAVVLGTLSVLIVCRLGRRLFRSTLLGCFAGLLMTLDGLHFVQSRVVMLDIALLFCIVAAAACLLADRDALRLRIAGRVSDGSWPTRRGTGLRWWRVAAGLFIGLACGVKWSGIYLIPAFCLLSLAWEIGARRVTGMPAPVRAALRQAVLPIALTLVLVPVLAYIATWSGWFLTDGGWRRDCSLAKPGGPWSGMGSPSSCGAISGLWQYHVEVLAFHNQLDDPHKYKSHTWGWLLLARPVLYFYQAPSPGQVQAVIALGTPAIWWASIPALGTAVWRWISVRDWRAAYLLAGFAATYLPWFYNDMHERTMFNFYALAALPFMCLALAYCAGLAMGSRSTGAQRRRWGAVAIGGYLFLVLWNFHFFYPVLTAKAIPDAAWQMRLWFSSWI